MWVQPAPQPGRISASDLYEEHEEHESTGDEEGRSSQVRAGVWQWWTLQGDPPSQSAADLIGLLRF